jgi:hypothetical protein
MHRRPVDPISLLFGTLFTVAAAIVLLGGSIVDDGHLLVPASLIGLGVAMFISSRANRTEQAPADAGTDLEFGEASGEDGPGDEIGAEGGEYG